MMVHRLQLQQEEMGSEAAQEVIRAMQAQGGVGRWSDRLSKEQQSQIYSGSCPWLLVLDVLLEVLLAGI
jgi:hypothetical protein